MRTLALSNDRTLALYLVFNKFMVTTLRVSTCCLRSSTQHPATLSADSRAMFNIAKPLVYSGVHEQECS